MTKIVIREIIISLLVCLAVLLILSVVLYNYIPTNKVVPETIEYSPSKDIQTQLSSEVEDNSEEILMTYEITAQDLDNYERTNEYNPGKANPFAPVSTNETPDPEQSGTSASGNTTTPSNPAQGNTSSNNQSSGSLFENPTSK